MAPSRTPYICARCALTLSSLPSSPSLHAAAIATTTTTIRSLSSSSSTRQQASTSTSTSTSIPSTDRPRWQQTPPTMKMPIRLRPLPKQPVWRVNEDPALVDEMYDSFIGRAGEGAKGQEGVKGTTRGRDLLSEEVKWLAITHKSFDQARRGFNDRLAFLGKRIVDLQTSLALLNAPPGPLAAAVKADRNVFQHPAIDGVTNLSLAVKKEMLSPSRLATLAQTYGVDKVVRWHPRKSDNLKFSGVETVLAHTVYAIVGALALQRGGEVAARTVRERILEPLGLK